MNLEQSAQLEAWATLAAAIFAAIAAVFAYRAYRKEMAVEARLVDNAERGQASMVAAWMGDKGGSAIPIVRNASEVPIFDVYIDFYYKGELMGSTSDEPGAITTYEPSTTGVESFLPETVIEKFQEAADNQIREMAMDLGIRFADSSGRHWKRAYNGALTRVSDSY